MKAKAAQAGAVAAGRTAKASVRREQLLATALALFSEHGYAATSTRRIADAAGVTEGLVFHYFPTKEALLLGVAARQHTFAGRVLVLLQSPEERTARELLVAVADGLASVPPEELSFIGFMMAEAQINASLRATVTAATSMMADAVAATLAKCVATGELRAEASLRATVHGFFGGFFFFFTQHRHLGPAAFRREAAVFAGAWADQCWRGIATAKAISDHAR